MTIDDFEPEKRDEDLELDPREKATPTENPNLAPDTDRNAEFFKSVFPAPVEFSGGEHPSRSMSQAASDPKPTESSAIATDDLSAAGSEASSKAASRSSRIVTKRDKEPEGKDSQPLHLATSTFLSLLMVLGLLLLARLMVPSLVESIRYGWHRGQLRAEYELSGQRLKSVSLDSLAEVSKLVSQRMGPSVVHIDVTRRVNLADVEGKSFDLRGPAIMEGQGSGFIISKDGYILTNDHVLEDSGEIEITLSDGRQLPATTVGRDPHTDLAVVKIEAGKLLPVEWGDSSDVVVGTPVWAVGSPFGLQQTVTFGIISGKHRVDFRSTGSQRNLRAPYGDLMQSDVALNPGNSGGPLVNSMGQVVGVNAAILGDTFQGVSFSIPSRVAEKVAEHLIAEGAVPRGWLGVVLVDLSNNEKFADDGSRRFGVRIDRFPPALQSPAKRAGLQVGDIIVDFEGTPIDDVASLIRMIGETVAGTEVVLSIDRPLKLAKGNEAKDGNDGSKNGANSDKSVSQEFERLKIEVVLDRRDPNL
ncbi:MAG: trypsin-like peptidase domain-containing protein [Planctomycetota bacterium]